MTDARDRNGDGRVDLGEKLVWLARHPVRHRHPANVLVLDGRSRADRAVDRFVALFGSLRFIAWMTVFIIAWIGLNGLAWRLRWDPYPWILLNLIFSTQASYAAPLILLSQNRQAEHDRVKAEHDYQVNEDSLGEIRANTQLTRDGHLVLEELRNDVRGLAAELRSQREASSSEGA